MKVLIIEDDPAIVESVSLTFDLRWDGVEFLSATHGEEGLKLVKTKSPDIVILDLGLPDIDGLNVLRQIRSFSNVPVIILTVRGNETDKVAGLELGADDYITKPFDVTEFLSRVKTVLRRSQMLESQVDKKLFEKLLVTSKLSIDLANRDASIAGKPLKLNPEGYELLLETLTEQDHQSNGSEDIGLEEVPFIYQKKPKGGITVTLEYFVRYVKSLYRACLGKIRHYSGSRKR